MIDYLLAVPLGALGVVGAAWLWLVWSLHRK